VLGILHRSFDASNGRVSSRIPSLVPRATGLGWSLPVPARVERLTQAEGIDNKNVTHKGIYKWTYQRQTVLAPSHPLSCEDTGRLVPDLRPPRRPLQAGSGWDFQPPPGGRAAESPPAVPPPHTHTHAHTHPQTPQRNNSGWLTAVEAWTRDPRGPKRPGTSSGTAPETGARIR